jgi:hypothetical protein
MYMGVGSSAPGPVIPFFFQPGPRKWNVKSHMSNFMGRHCIQGLFALTLQNPGVNTVGRERRALENKEHEDLWSNYSAFLTRAIYYCFSWVAES